MVELWWAATGFAAFIVAAPLWWLVPKWQMQSVTAGGPKASLAKADIEDNFRKTIGQALGGIAALPRFASHRTRVFSPNDIEELYELRRIRNDVVHNADADVSLTDALRY
jgi:hypothetical protein